MRYYLCDAETIVDESGPRKTPTIERHISDWNTYKGYDPVSSKVLVACDPDMPTRNAIEADLTCRFVVATNESFDRIARRQPSLPGQAMNAADKSRANDIATLMSFNIIFDGVSTGDEVVTALYQAVRARQ